VNVQRIVSGGQTGADRGGLDAAAVLQLERGGWCPKGRRAEDGRVPASYELRETTSESYVPRTEMNVRDSDATVIFTRGPLTGGSALTERVARSLRRPCLHIAVDGVVDPVATLRDWCLKHRVATLNVAGSRESKSPGIQARTRDIVVAALRRA